MACHGLQQTPSDTILKSTRRVMGGSDILRNSWSPDHQMVSVTPSHKRVVTTFFQFPDISIIDLKREHLQRNFSTFGKWVFSFIVSFWERRTLLWIRWIMKYIQWWCKEETKANFPLFVGTPGQHDILTKFELGKKHALSSHLPCRHLIHPAGTGYWTLDCDYHKISGHIIQVTDPCRSRAPAANLECHAIWTLEMVWCWVRVNIGQ